MKISTTDALHFSRAHRAGVTAMFDAWEKLHTDGPGRPYVHEPQTTPFCGCEDCEVRVVLSAAWPYLKDAARQEVLRGNH